MLAEDVRVDPGRWHERCAELASEGATMIDVLAAVDDPDAGHIEIVAHLVDVASRRRVLVWTSVDRSEPVLVSLVDLFRGAAWHEREIHEMFGVVFAGNPDLSPLLTTGDMGFPLLRTTPLPARRAASWPGAVEPSDRPAPGRAAAARPRSRPGPPGIPAEWPS